MGGEGGERTHAKIITRDVPASQACLLSLHPLADDRAEDERLARLDEVDDRRRADGLEVFEEGTSVAAVGWDGKAIV